MMYYFYLFILVIFCPPFCLPKAESEPSKIFFKLDMWANKIYLNKNLRPQNKVLRNLTFGCQSNKIECGLL